MSDKDDSARKKVLARRASFVAAALAGVACGKEAAKPQPCLSMPQPTETAPQPCLSVATSEPEPPTPDAPDAGTPKPPDAGPPKPKPNPPPRPCLKIAPPGDQ